MENESKKQAENFLEEISSEDNVLLITDHDPDGFTSGTLFYDFCTAKGSKVTQFTWVRGISNAKDLNVDPFTKIITTDLAASQVKEVLEKFSGEKALSMDHHPTDATLPKNTIVYNTMYRGYLPSARTAYELTEGKKWLALVGTIADAADRYPENKEFIEETLKELNMDLEGFKKQIVFPISNCITYFEKDPSKAFNLIRDLKNPEEIASIKPYSDPIEEEIERIKEEFDSKKENIDGAIYYYFESAHNVKSGVNSISMNPGNEEKIFLFATPKNEEKISISARNQSKKMDMAVLLRAGIKGLEDSQAGGHFAASGATIKKEDLNKFKVNIKNFLESN